MSCHRKTRERQNWGIPNGNNQTRIHPRPLLLISQHASFLLPADLLITRRPGPQWGRDAPIGAADGHPITGGGETTSPVQPACPGPSFSVRHLRTDSVSAAPPRRSSFMWQMRAVFERVMWSPGTAPFKAGPTGVLRLRGLPGDPWNNWDWYISNMFPLADCVRNLDNYYTFPVI